MHDKPDAWYCIFWFFHNLCAKHNSNLWGKKSRICIQCVNPKHTVCTYSKFWTSPKYCSVSTRAVLAVRVQNQWLTLHAAVYRSLIRSPAYFISLHKHRALLCSVSHWEQLYSLCCHCHAYADYMFTDQMCQILRDQTFQYWLMLQFWMWQFVHLLFFYVSLRFFM